MRILLIDDQPRMGETFSKILRALKHQVTYIDGGAEALKVPDDELLEYDIILIDMNMPGMDGCETGLALKERIQDLVTIMLTADSSIETVIKALRDSKFDDYLCKSEVAKDAFEGSFKLQETFMRAQSLLKTRQELRNTQNALSQEYQLSEILRKQSLESNKELIGNSESFNRIRQLIQKVAPSDASILIQGETGTGKELVARAIHRQSLRAHEPFVAINCGAIPKELLESELFGHRRGAFTGASSDREGFFQLANRGTLFLDEIGDMPLDLQVKLLRVLQEQEIMPVGGKKPIKVDVRIISATHQNLQSHIDAHQFREDLFYRLNVFPIRIPPLRERIDDLELMVKHFIVQKSNYSQVKGVTPEAMQLLKGYTWRGNVRELENMVERAMLITNHELLTPEDFLEIPVSPSAPVVQPAPPIAVAHDNSQVAPVQPPAHGYENPLDFEPLWQCFQENQYKLWTIEDFEQVQDELRGILKQSEYQKKGHFGFLKVNESVDVELKLKYVNTHSNSVELHTLKLGFLSEKIMENGHAVQSRENTQGLISVQPVLKGLPDTYIFDILYPPAKRSSIGVHSPQQLVRALILRYAQACVPSRSLKGIFEDVMTFLVDPVMSRSVKGLNKDGLEAMRACLCSKSHIFPGVASQLKVNPRYIAEEIQKVFPNYVGQVQ